MTGFTRVLTNLVLGLAAPPIVTLIHELGHVAAARSCGLEPRMRVGYVAGQTRYPRPGSPRLEIAITAAGPCAQAGAHGALGALRGGRSFAIPAALLAITRHLGDFPRADGERIWGRRYARERNTAYWTAALALVVTTTARGMPWVLLEHLTLYDIPIRKAVQWGQVAQSKVQLRRSGLTL